MYALLTNESLKNPDLSGEERDQKLKHMSKQLVWIKKKIWQFIKRS